MLVEEQLFLIKEYEKKSTFAGFLPGINGWNGIPLWCFYVNRGQCITSFGTMDKEHSIMEFYPAHQAYQRTETMGFRTFLKVDGVCKEAFSDIRTKKNMYIGKNELRIEEIDEELELCIKVCYTTLPEEPVAGLVRQVEIINLSSQHQKVEVLDGMPEIVPYGVSLSSMKEMAQTSKAWMEVLDHEKRMPRFKVRVSMEDSAQVSEISGSHFALAVSEEELLSVVVGKDTIFGYDTALKKPIRFYEKTAMELCREKQKIQNDAPCCFFAKEKTLAGGESVCLNEIYGMYPGESSEGLTERVKNAAYFEEKQKKAREIAEELTDVIATKTGDAIFDEYCRQSYMDNVLRGGYPIALGRHIFYIYSRKHGDIERDYNFFAMYPESYSQGNGNFRDVNQNRRCDVQFAPFVKEKNIKQFYSCIQTNGYNPLGIEKSVYQLATDKYKDIVEGKFTPGKLYDNLRMQVPDERKREELFLEILNEAEELHETRFIEGYWTDHWSYNLDLVESYLSVYPEKEMYLLFEDAEYTYRQSEAAILPRKQRYEKTEQGIRQYHFLKELETLGKYVEDRTGKIVYTTLAEKLFLLCTMKTAALDPYGMGIEMEGGKPGWYDALNGLPGIFGSSMADTYELKRMLTFFKERVKAYGKEIKIFKELWELASDMGTIIRKQEEEWREDGCNLNFWNQINDRKEQYWSETESSISGEYETVSANEVYELLESMDLVVSCGIEQASTIGSGVVPTYFSYEVTYYEEKDGICPTGFALKKIPEFLEGPVRALKLDWSEERKQRLYEQVKESKLYDRKLKMYKVNQSLKDASFELGRAKAFTPGWLENESIWLHMEYKYLLEVLKTGMYEEFAEDFKNAAVPFMNEEIYGRSLLENSSFIASSENPDSSIHGKGFVARLSGSTAEFLQIWQIMMFGKTPFTYEDDTLQLAFCPAIPAYLIGEEKSICAKFLGTTDVVYHLADRKAWYPGTYETRACEIVWNDGSKDKRIELSSITAERIRSGEAKRIEVKLERK